MSKKINYLIDAVTQSTKYMVSGSRFGLREAKWGLLADYKGKNYHIGVDYGTTVGTPLYAPDSAEVVMCDANGKGAYGRYVMLYLPYQNVSIHLAHMNKVDVKLGQKVNKGTKVGTSGNTGLSSGPHLHLGLASGRKTNLNKGSYGDKTWLNPSKYDFKVFNRKSNEDIAKEVLAGKWGNNPKRKNDLIKAGYDYNAIQAIVNKGFVPSKPALKSNEAIAREVINGNWGNGATRKKRLKQAGYNPATIQAIVNKLLK